METITFLIAVIALVIAIIAFRRTGGMGDTRRQLDLLSSKTEGIRDKTADALQRVEELIRGREKSRDSKDDPGDQSSKPG